MGSRDDRESNSPRAWTVTNSHSRYCFSHNTTSFIGCPCGFVPVDVIVRVFPSAKTAMRLVDTCLPPTLTIKSTVRLSIRLYDRVVFGAPYGYCFPSSSRNVTSWGLALLPL